MWTDGTKVIHDPLLDDIDVNEDDDFESEIIDAAESYLYSIRKTPSLSLVGVSPQVYQKLISLSHQTNKPISRLLEENML